MAIRLEVTVGELTLRDREVDRLEIAQTLGDHHRLSLSFHRDPSQSLELRDLVAPAVTVSLTDDVTKKSVDAFLGVGTGCEERLQPHGGSRFVLSALSLSERYSRRHHVTTIPAATLGDVVERYEGVTIGATPPARRAANYVQAGEDDFAFLLRLADDHKCFVRPTVVGLEIRHGFDDAQHVLTFGKNLQFLTTRVAAVNPREKGAFYDFRRKEEVLLRDRQDDAPMSGATKITDAVKQQAHSLNGALDPNVPESASRRSTIADFRDLLLSESQRALGAAVTIDGVSTNIELAVGDSVNIQGGSTFKLDDAPGTVGLTRVTHSFDGQQYTNSFTASPWVNFSSASQPPRRIITGLVTAEVTANDDPSMAGRIRVREVGINPANEDSHFWARLLTPFAGNGRGIAFVPEIGDEVVLAFEEGDPERPFVVGSVWNGKDVSPGATPKRIVTKAGNQIVMNDAGVIEIFTPGGACMVQLSNGIDGKPRVTIHSEGHLLLEAKETLQIKCKNFVSTIDEDFKQNVGGDEDTSVSGSRLAQTGSMDVHNAGEGVSLLVGGTAIELSANSIVSQSLEIMSVAKDSNVVVGLTVQLNPPAFRLPPSTPPGFPDTPIIESSWGGRENPKPTERVKVTRDDGPTR